VVLKQQHQQSQAELPPQQEHKKQQAHARVPQEHTQADACVLSVYECHKVGHPLLLGRRQVRMEHTAALCIPGLSDHTDE
jgi:hypothetical protein